MYVSVCLQKALSSLEQRMIGTSVTFCLCGWSRRCGRSAFRGWPSGGVPEEKSEIDLFFLWGRLSKFIQFFFLGEGHLDLFYPGVGPSIFFLSIFSALPQIQFYILKYTNPATDILDFCKHKLTAPPMKPITVKSLISYSIDWLPCRFLEKSMLPSFTAPYGKSDWQLQRYSTLN